MHVHAECPTVDRQDPCPHVADVAGDTNTEQNERTKCTVRLTVTVQQKEEPWRRAGRALPRRGAQPGPGGGELCMLG